MIKETGLGLLLLFGPIALTGQDTTKNKINLNLPKIETPKIQTNYDKGIKKIQYNFPISKKIFLFTEYNALEPQYQKPILKPKQIRFGIKFKF
jgi:hypothetical protein